MSSIADPVSRPLPDDAVATQRARKPARVADTTVSLPIAKGERELRLDLFRGLALWLIFIDHLPTNILTWFTIRNYGFSDATEIFIFISGYTAAFVYGRAMLEQGFVVAAARILKRVWQIYVAHVFLFTIFLAEISYVATRFDNPLYSEEMGILDFLRQPDVTIVQALLLRFRPVNMDVLPLYIVLMLFLGPILWLMQRKPDVTLGLSVLLYALTWEFDLYLSAYPNGVWAFNPFAWQLLFVFGAWCALGGARRMARVLASPITLGLAIAYLLAAFWVTLTWYVPQFNHLLPRLIEQWMYPINKTDLDVLRFAHFLALAALTVRFLKKDWPGLRSPWMRPLILCGQHSLEIFCIGVFLAFAGHFFLAEVSGGALSHFLVSLSGIIVMSSAAWVFSWYKRTAGKAGPQSKGANADADLAGGEGMTAGRLGAALALLLGLAASPARAEAQQSCDVPAYLLSTDSRLARAAAAEANGKLDILVVGSRSSTLAPPEQAFPARLETMLRDKLPKVQISIAVDIQPKKTAEEIAAEFSRALATRKPDLVIWQTGTVDAMRSIDPDEFRSALDDGVSAILATGTDAILMNLQYSPRTETMISAASYLDNMRVVAQQHDVPLFDRFAMMRHWSESGDFDLFSPSPGVDLARRVHDCLARALTTFIVDATRANADDVRIQR